MPTITTLKEQYDEALKSIKFSETSVLERTIIDEHKEEGILYLLQRKISGNIQFIHNLKDENCPWYGLKDDSNSQIIDAVWQSLSTKLPSFLTLFKARCQHILVQELNGEWQLIYFLDSFLEDEIPYYSVYLGSAPINDEDIEDRPKLHKSIEHHLGFIYQIHNGFGEWNSEFVLPFDELTQIQHEDIKYLAFFDFVSSARQCLKMTELALENPPTYDIQKSILNNYHPFWQFLDERLGLIDEE